MFDSLWLHGPYSPQNSLGQNTGVGNISLLQGIFPTQGSNPGLPHCRWILQQLSHKGSPRTLEWVACPFFSGSSRPRNQTRVSCTAGGFFTNWPIREAQWILNYCFPKMVLLICILVSTTWLPMSLYPYYIYWKIFWSVICLNFGGISFLHKTLILMYPHLSIFSFMAFTFFIFKNFAAKSLQWHDFSHVRLCNPMDHSLPRLLCP